MAAVAGILGTLGVLVAKVDEVATQVGNVANKVGVFLHVIPPPYPACVSVQISHQPVVPDALRHNYWPSQALYWLRLDAENECSDTVALRVICDFYRSDVGVGECPDYPTINLAPGRTVLRQIDPRLNILTEFSYPATMDVEIRVADERNEHTWIRDVIGVQVLPRTMYFWNLEETTRETMLASLAVWTIRPRGVVAEMATELAGGYESIDNWMRQAYERVFSRLEVIEDDRWIPPRAGTDRLDIRTPEAILAGESAIPIETALLFGALAYEVVRGRNARIVVIVTRDDGDSTVAPSVFVAWQSALEDGRLRAFATSGGEVDSFEEATSEAAERLAGVTSRILEEFDREGSNGVYYVGDESGLVVALDLGRAIIHHGFTGGLP